MTADRERLTRYAKAMRHDPVANERALWKLLRNRRLEGLKFRRQVPSGRYIADFLCLRYQLIVEADGPTHEDSLYDFERDARLRGQGFRVLRFQTPRSNSALGMCWTPSWRRLTHSGVARATPHPASFGGHLLPHGEKGDNVAMPFRATVLTMFPEAFPGPLAVSLIGTAWRERGLWALETVDIRAFSTDKRGFLDDTPAGGGPGQVMRADVIASALDSVEAAGRPLLYMSARGRPLTQGRVRQWASGPGLIVLCGRFEGVDQRVIEARGFEEVSVGDAVLAGGEAAAMVAIEACVRLLPGVLGEAASLNEESFENDLLEHPQYTRPRTFEGRDIPEVLLSGHHGEAAKWRRQQREETTRERRPDLWSAHLANQQAKGDKAQ